MEIKIENWINSCPERYYELDTMEQVQADELIESIYEYKRNTGILYKV